MDYQGDFRFAGIPAEGPCSFVKAPGPRPSIFTLSFPLAASLPQVAAMIVRFGPFQRLLPDCYLLRVTITAGGGSGRWQRAIVADRRWKWAFGGWVKTYRRATPQAVVNELLTQGLGEPRFQGLQFVDNSVLIDLECDGEPPAKYLMQILEAQGLTIDLTWNNDLAIWPIGVGPPPPLDQRVMDQTISFEPPQIPQQIDVLAMRTWLQTDIPLEPVTFEDEESAVPVRLQDVSWRPQPQLGQEPFSETDVSYFGKVQDPKKREIARRTVWKYFRVAKKARIHNPLPPAIRNAYPGLGAELRLDDPRLRLTLREEQLPILFLPPGFPPTGDVDLPEIAQPQVLGYFNTDTFSWSPNVPLNKLQLQNYGPEIRSVATNDQAKRELQIERSFRLDTDRQLVIFDEPVFYPVPGTGYDDPGTRTPPKALRPPIVLRTSFTIEWDGVPVLAKLGVPVQGGLPGLNQVLREPLIRAEFHRRRSTTTEQLQQVSQGVVSQLSRGWYRGDAREIPYKGLTLDIENSGATRAVTLQRDDAGACTSRVEFQQEMLDQRLTLQEKAQNERIVRVAANVFVEQAKREQRGGDVRRS